MAINFPDSPSTNDTHVVGDRTWIWNGTYWHVKQGVGVTIWADADSDTKIQVEESSDEDIIRFDTAGTERMVVLADGKVGVGTASPGYPLETGGDIRIGGGGDIRLSDSSAAGTTANDTILYNDAETLSFWVNGAARAKILSDGTVSIGKTSNDGKNLEVYQASNAAIRVQNSTTSTGAAVGLLLEMDGSDVHVWNYSNGYMRFGANNTEHMRITSAGNVGIGTTSPVSALEIASDEDLTDFTSTARGALTISNTDYNSGDYQSIDFRYNTSSGPNARVAAKHTGSGSYLSFGTSNNYVSGVTNEAMVIDYMGNVGIGTQTPVAKLSVTSGSTNSSAHFGKYDDEGLFLHSDAQATHYNWRITTQTVVDQGFEIAASTAVGGTTWADPTFVIKQNGGVVIDGNAGIGSLTLKGDGSGYTHSHIVVESEDSTRGGGMYCYNSADDVNWFVGMPYGIADSFSINHKDNASFDVSTADDGYCTFQIREAATTHGGTHQEYGGVGFAAASVWIDRNWGNYPGITVCNTTIASGTTQGEFRIHGANHSWASYPATSGSDFGCSLRIDGSYIPSSDGRSKTNVENITGALASVTAMQGVAFNRKTREGETETLERHVGGKRYGFIAQDAKDHVPHATVYYADEDTPLDNGWCNSYSFDYGGLTAVLVEAIKELSAKVEALESA